MKGRGFEGTIERVISNLATLGHKEVILRTDQEPAILDLVNGVIETRTEPTLPENSPVGESQSNGMVERAVRPAKDHIRTLRLALMKRIGRMVPPGHPIMPWMTQHSGELICKYQKNKDGKTAYEKLKVKPCNEEIVEFGEYVHYRISNVDTGSLDARWGAGVWLGKRWRSTEHYVGTPQGVVKSYAIQRKPLEERWDAEAIEAITGTPWNLTPLPTDDEGPRVHPPLPEDLRLREGPRPKEPEVRAPLRPSIKQADLDRWGYTDGCLRCRLARSGKANDGSKHSE